MYITIEEEEKQSLRKNLYEILLSAREPLTVGEIFDSIEEVYLKRKLTSSEMHTIGEIMHNGLYKEAWLVKSFNDKYKFSEGFRAIVLNKDKRFKDSLNQ